MAVAPRTGVGQVRVAGQEVLAPRSVPQEGQAPRPQAHLDPSPRPAPTVGRLLRHRPARARADRPPWEADRAPEPEPAAEPARAQLRKGPIVRSSQSRRSPRCVPMDRAWEPRTSWSTACARSRFPARPAPQSTRALCLLPRHLQPRAPSTGRLATRARAAGAATPMAARIRVRATPAGISSARRCAPLLTAGGHPLAAFRAHLVRRTRGADLAVRRGAAARLAVATHRAIFFAARRVPTPGRAPSVGGISAPSSAGVGQTSKTTIRE